MATIAYRVTRDGDQWSLSRDGKPAGISYLNQEAPFEVAVGEAGADLGPATSSSRSAPRPIPPARAIAAASRRGATDSLPNRRQRMPVTLTVADVGLRVLITALAAVALGYDRRVEGRPAGVRTTLLVALAACLSMVQANWLINTVGKAPDSFVVLDLMRSPLGILTGVGFIGGGAILKRGDSVTGLTTAATLWFVTVIGLCFGGGQLGLGAGGAILGYFILHGLKRVEGRLRQERPAQLNLKWRQDAFDAGAHWRRSRRPVLRSPISSSSETSRSGWRSCAAPCGA